MYEEAGLRIEEMYYVRKWPIVGTHEIGRSPMFRLFTYLMIIKAGRNSS
jgi:hypothetical protein